MSLQRVFFAFFVLLALSMNFGFFYGKIDDVLQHNLYELFGAIVVNLIATILKLGERSHFGALMLASSLVADVGLIGAALVLGYASHIAGGMSPQFVASAVSMAGGALVANIVSVTLLITEAATLRR